MIVGESMGILSLQVGVAIQTRVHAQDTCHSNTQYKVGKQDTIDLRFLQFFYHQSDCIEFIIAEIMTKQNLCIYMFCSYDPIIDLMS